MLRCNALSLCLMPFRELFRAGNAAPSMVAADMSLRSVSLCLTLSGLSGRYASSPNCAFSARSLYSGALPNETLPVGLV
jgi:hypothetical protein